MQPWRESFTVSRTSSSCSKEKETTTRGSDVGSTRSSGPTRSRRPNLPNTDCLFASPHPADAQTTHSRHLHTLHIPTHGGRTSKDWSAASLEHSFLILGFIEHLLHVSPFALHQNQPMNNPATTNYFIF
ncbi:hypothetical protein GJAV_G00261690 [Gymnothorax javanicus]|nr:hypothetical protein GJAV_G00261690 [Gymnothorax javanicus]